jgi:hypothetical protein
MTIPASTGPIWILYTEGLHLSHHLFCSSNGNRTHLVRSLTSINYYLLYTIFAFTIDRHSNPLIAFGATSTIIEPNKSEVQYIIAHHHVNVCCFFRYIVLYYTTYLRVCELHF